MERIKRQLKDSDSTNNKKQKIQNEIRPSKSYFEHLANETIYEIFDYLDVYHVYHGFFYLNNRFKNLLINSNLPFQINISNLSKTNFELYYEHMIKPNRRRINILRLSNPFIVDLVFSPPRTICDFIQLETLIFDNINSKYLHNILKYLAHLPKLYSLTLSLMDYIQDPTLLFLHVFRLSKLKSCQITYQTKDDEDILPVHFDEYEQCSIEYLTINSRFRYESFNQIFICLPKLRYLSINCLMASRYTDTKLYPIVLKDLKHVSFKLDSIYFNRFEKLVKNFFGNIEVLQLTTINGSTHSDAEHWEELISSSMPNLRIFDIQDHCSSTMGQFLYACRGGQYRSKFWTERQWYFTQQHRTVSKSPDGMFYSTNPYRRTDYTIYCQSYDYTYSHIEEKNFNSVKHVYLCGKQVIYGCGKYFPNATELTIKAYFSIDDSISRILNRIIPVNQLNKLFIDCNDFSIRKMIKLISCTPNLHTLKWNFQSIDQTDLNLIQQSETFRYVSNTNQVKHLELPHCHTLQDIQFIVHLFPQLEYLKTGIVRRKLVQITQCFLLNLDHLFFLCITDVPKTYLKRLSMFIEKEELLDDYYIKFLNRDLYLWW